MALENVEDSIKSCFQPSSHQNLLKFDIGIHCIMYISMLKITCSAFMSVFSVFVLLAWEYNYIPSELLFLCYYLYFSS